MLLAHATRTRKTHTKIVHGCGLQGTRAAINTPIQGSAADIVMLAMIALEDQPRLREPLRSLLPELICDRECLS